MTTQEITERLRKGWIQRVRIQVVAVGQSYGYKARVRDIRGEVISETDVVSTPNVARDRARALVAAWPDGRYGAVEIVD